MQNTQYPIWKRIRDGVLWSAGILAYASIATSVFFSIMANHQVNRWLDPLGNNAYFVIGIFLVSLFAIPGWQLIVHKHRMAGWILVAAAAVCLAGYLLMVVMPFLRISY